MICRIVLFAGVVLGLFGGAVNGEEKPPPNILFILADDLGYEKLGCYGGLGTRTPRLNQLARQGMRFERAYGSPVCTPTRVSLYSGQYPTRHQITGVLPVHTGTKVMVDFAERFPCYAQQLREAGYLTSVTGKWQLATLEFYPDHIRDAGFDSWCVWQIWKDGAKTTRYWEPCFNEDGVIRDDIADRFGPDVLADYVIAQMKEAVAAGKPFLIHHNMLLPHEPIVETPADRKAGREPNLSRMIRYLDRLVGRIVDAVDEIGIAENTCIVFLGDNGTDTVHQIRTTNAGIVRGGKRTLDDGGTHLPLIVRWPGTVAADAVAADLVDVADFFPTFCELAGASLPEGRPMDGVSFAGRLLRGEATGREVVVSGYLNNFSAFNGEWRLSSDGTVRDARKLPQEQIFKPGETSEIPEETLERLQSFLQPLP